MQGATKLKVCISGQSIEIESVTMHSTFAILRWQKLLAEAQQLMANFSTGIGFIGSPEFVFAGAAAMGMLESMVTNANHKRGLEILLEAHALHSRMSGRGVFVPVSKMAGVESPAPSNWSSRGLIESEMDVRGIEKWKIKELKERYGATDQELQTGFLIRTTEQDLSVMPDEFITCISSGRHVQLKWSSIEVYELV